MVALVSALEPVAAPGAVAAVLEPALPAELAPALEVAPAPVLLLLGPVAELELVDGLALEELGELVV